MAESNHRVTSSQSGQKLRQILKGLLGWSSKKVNECIDCGLVKVNGKIEKFGSRSLKAGDVLLFPSMEGGGGKSLDNKKRRSRSPAFVLDRGITDQDFALDREDLLVFLKPAGIPSQRTRDPKRVTAEGLVQDWARKKGYGRVVLTHRLDRDTSGLLLFGKGEVAATMCMDWFKHRKVKKTYFALCRGVTKEVSGTWQQFLGTGQQKGGRQQYRVVRSGGAKAITDYQVLESRQGHSLWRLNPQTGRTHQLRVQLQDHGFPIVGDDLYGGAQGHPQSAHHLLHAGELLLPPESGLNKALRAPWPNGFDVVLRDLKFKTRDF